MGVKLPVSQKTVLDKVDRAIAIAQQQSQINALGIKILLEDILRNGTPDTKVESSPQIYIDIMSFYSGVCRCIALGEEHRGPNQQAVLIALNEIRHKYRETPAEH